GLITVAATIGLVSAFGVIGVPLGSLTGLLLTNGPATVVWMSRAAGVGPLAILGWSAQWAMGVALAFGAVTVFAFTPWAGNLAFAVGVLTLSLIFYTLFVWPIIRRDPLRDYTERAMKVILGKWRPLSNKESDTEAYPRVTR